MRRSLCYSVLALVLAACAGEFTPTPTNAPPATDTVAVAIRPSATGTRGLPARQQTLPPTFTPTYTPTETLTPTVTYTPTATFTSSPVPEELLCDGTFATTNRRDGARYTNNDSAVFFQLGNVYEVVILRLTITLDDADEPIVDGFVPSNLAGITSIPIDAFEDSGRYTWRVRVYQGEETGEIIEMPDEDDGFCDPLTGFFNVDLDAPTNTPIPTETVEPTSNVIIVTATPDAEVTPEVQFIVVTATPDAEVTPDVEQTAEVTPELAPTEDATSEDEDE